MFTHASAKLTVGADGTASANLSPSPRGKVDHAVIGWVDAPGTFDITLTAIGVYGGPDVVIVEATTVADKVVVRPRTPITDPAGTPEPLDTEKFLISGEILAEIANGTEGDEIYVRVNLEDS